MLLQTNSYIVPKERRAEHARLMRRFRQILNRIGCDNFEVYEQVGANWGTSQTSGRFVQIMRFRDRRHQLAVQNAERTDQGAQDLIAEFCELINYPYQVQQNLFAVGFYHSVLPVAPLRIAPEAAAEEAPAEEAPAVEAPAEEVPAEEVTAEEVTGEAEGAVEPSAEPPAPENFMEPAVESDVTEVGQAPSEEPAAADSPVAGDEQVESFDPEAQVETVEADATESTAEDDDPISRLAQEFSEEPDAFHHKKGRASGNGAH